MSKASKARNIIMTSPLGLEYQDVSKITEVWSDLLTPKRLDDSEGLEGIYCLRICDIFYDLVSVTERGDGYLIQALITGLQNKPSVASQFLGRLVNSDAGVCVTNFDWEKLSEKDEPENKVVFGGAYSIEGSEVCWGEDMKLCIRLNGDLCQVSEGPINAEQGKMLANAINSYVKRCERFYNPLPPVQRKPRQKKVAATAENEPFNVPEVVNEEPTVSHGDKHFPEDASVTFK